MLWLPTNHRSLPPPASWRSLGAALLVCLSASSPLLSAQKQPDEKAAAPTSGAGEAPTPAHLKQLTDYGLEPTTESLGRFLASLHPDEEQARQIESLIKQLGDDDFQRREAAMAELLRQPLNTAERLEAAIGRDNAEIRWRAKHILTRSERDSRSLLHAVFTAIERQQIAGLTKPLLDSAEFCKETYLQNALHRALAATASAGDAPLLRSRIQSADARQQVAAIMTLDSLQVVDVAGEALALLADCDEAVRSAAARVLARHGRRESLAALIELLESSAITVRLDAFRTLRALTGEHFGYTVYDAPENRALAVKEWQSWLAEKGTTAPLRLPLRELPVDLGRLLVCDHGQNKLIEFDASGKEVWQRQAPLQPWACFGLPNGHRLVGSYNERCIIEYDRDGTEVWKVDNLPGGPTSVQRLENGNTLVACTEGSQVVEIGPDKQVIWKATLEGRPVDARRLDNGNTLVALQNAQKVVEIDADGKTVWQIESIGMAFSAQRLPDGNTLVCSLNLPEVREFDPAGKVVWSKGAFTNPYTAQRLADGNTIVVDRAGIVEIDPQGNTVRRIPMSNVSRVWRY